jgi:hypothetical protein
MNFLAHALLAGQDFDDWLRDAQEFVSQWRCTNV